MRLKDSIGRYSWELKETIDSMVSHGGSGSMWSNPDSHPSTLVERRNEGNPFAPDFRVAQLLQWQKVGRSINEVVVARYILSPEGEWKSVPADAQPLQTR